MNVNIKLTLSEQDRNLIARKIAGKDIKRLCSRSDVVEMVNGFMAGYLNELVAEKMRVDHPNNMTLTIDPPNLSRVPDEYAKQSDHWKISYLRGRYGK